MATRLFITTQWASQGDFNYDGGMAKVGTTTDDTQGTNDLRLSCNMTGGSSCGPWFQSFSTGSAVARQRRVDHLRRR